METQPDPDNEKRRLTPQVQSHLGKQLQTMYADIVAQGVPERLAALIRRLDDQTAPTAAAPTSKA
jgi:anti-sigma factor NepR-like protein